MKDKMPTLKNIINSSKKGDRLAQRQLYEAYYSYGVSICMRYASHKEEAYEMLNDGFFKVFTKLDKYDMELPFRPWFKVVVVNAAIDYYRRKKSFETTDLEQTHTKVVDDFDIEEQLAYDDLIKVIQQLSPAYRTVFNLYEIEGYKHHEIADILDISVGTSKSNLSKAKGKLKKLIEKNLQTKMN